MTAEAFQKIAPAIPLQPGIYKYFDAGGQLLYVGKAKSLRKRVSSYFIKTFTSYKTHELVQRIDRIEFTIVDSEQDAFLLENALIKQFKPKYNINLKDDKTYPYIVFKNEPFPRVFLTRRKISDGSDYLGPFTSVGKVRELIEFIRQTVPLRTCKLNLSPQNIAKGKFKVCLEYHLGNCKGPCEGLQTLEEYKEDLRQAKNLLKGNLTPVIQYFRREMQAMAEAMRYEQAELTRKKLEHVLQYQAKSTIVNEKMGDVDVFSILKEGNQAYVNYLMVREGTIIQTQTSTFETQLEEDQAEVLSYAVPRLRDDFSSDAPEVIVPLAIDWSAEGVTITEPKTGDKRKLLDLSEKNVNYFRAELQKKKMLHLEDKTEAEKEEVLYQLQEDLHLPALPVHIECFDNSNFQGSFPVSAMVCFRNGIASKKDYRHFNVKTVTGINDFATMKEVVHRRYSRLVREDQDLPQLVIIDGGKGQLSAAMEAIRELGLVGKMTLVGLAKNEEEIFFPGDTQSLKLPWDSESLRLIRRIRDEVHRFGITFHRDQRSKGVFTSELEDIKGVGKATVDLLLTTYKSVKKVAQAGLTDLSGLVGPAKAEAVYRHFHPEEP
ncbi:MAG TPA: excinuclease ABC subunit UvrC [Dinghuibacter sp.]|uniref:excinuclease ABC subunit UvrC n=1 Tax=Dinghuibacter sp. TaxID=2024697 RepID=UPI002B551FE4|nr:excinuclease ABC subunit UvrC [Dinghuibacter sp.]HTJ14201.1 excinuclease ABC subunit UvrC [Dinghuibacter sp.]